MDVLSALGVLRSLVIYRMRPLQNRRLRVFYRDLISPGDLCFDIGAHVGSRAAAMIAAGGRVVALEPQTVFHRVLRHLPSERLTVLPLAVGDHPGQLDLYVSRLHPTVTTLSPNWIATVGQAPGFRSVKWDRTVTVEVTTLDALIASHGMPRFCKIDVEGMEASILEGLSQAVPLIAFEYLPAALSTAHACIDRLEKLGTYEYNRVSGERHRFEEDGWLDATGIRERLKGVTKTSRSGDIYARLVSADERGPVRTRAPGNAPARETRP